MTEKERANQNLLLELSAAFNARNMDRMLSNFSEDASLDMPRGGMPWGTRFNGKDAVRPGRATRFEMTPDVQYGEARHWVSGGMDISE
jgi:ketosteroid isomerase-like protein